MDFCLLCLEMRNSQDDGIQVDSSLWLEENIAQLIVKYFWPMKTISNTASLCLTCWRTINEFHKFNIRVENAHACFTSVLKTESQDNELEEIYICNDMTTAKTTIDDVHLGSEITIAMEQKMVKVQLSMETVSDKEENLLCVKMESEAENQLNNVQNEKYARRHSLGNKDPLKKPPKSRMCKKLAKKLIARRTCKEIKNTGKKTSNDNQDKATISEDELAEGNKCNSDSDVPTDLDCDAKSYSNSVYQPSKKYKSQDEFVAKNFKLICGICQAYLNTFHEVCKHSAREHNQRGFVTCCNKKFFRRSTLVEHIHWHLDPEYFKCKSCGKVMADRHCLNIHSRVHEKQDRTHICDECGKAFARALALQRHKLIHIPDEEKKYSCNQCGKNFGDNKLLSNHKRSVHLNKYALVCDICGRRMRSKEVFERHMLKHEGLPIPTVSCDVCGLKMTDPRGLKRHKEMQHPEGGRVEYKCHICSKVSPTLKAHKKHVQYKHELGYDFKCTICEKAFKRAISLTEHMATHTGTVLYTCPHCPKTFNSNANMHNHRKKGHPKEWEEACRAKYSGNLPPNYKPSNA